MLQRQAFAYGAIGPVKYDKKPQNVKANQKLVWREFVINTKTTGSLGNTPLMIARVVGLASDEKEALRGSVFLQCDQASAAWIRRTGFHFRFAQGQARLKLVAYEAMPSSCRQNRLEARSGVGGLAP